MRKQKITIIGCAGVPGNYGGFETLAHHLVLNFMHTFKTYVYCSKSNYSKNERISEWEGAQLIYLPFKANGIQSVIYDIISILHAVFFADVLLVLGVSGSIVLPVVKLLSNKKIIVNIDGLEWKRDKWNGFARNFLKFSEKIAVQFADEIIADNVVIQKYVKEEYGKEATYIAYGADHVERTEVTEESRKQYPFLQKDYAFTVCRIEPENNIEMILEAFAASPKQNYVIVGNWENSEYGKKIKLKFNSFVNVIILDPIYDIRKLNLLRTNCAFYIHGHSAGGTNPSLVEAMFAELPVICFDINYNRSTTQQKALYFSDANDLIKILNNITNRQLKPIAEDMKKMANLNYTWGKITEQYAQLLEYTKTLVHSPTI